ncbi:MAG: hypothetical protein KAS32_21125 [Candidatus Peribacteraceae bacterium]|nr:hypothetical protein [Candidatus Peribacteraceae bacterium]
MKIDSKGRVIIPRGKKYIYTEKDYWYLVLSVLGMALFWLVIGDWLDNTVDIFGFKK